MINTNDILETIGMIQDESLDIRTITMGDHVKRYTTRFAARQKSLFQLVKI